jgi:hypothetical protein
MEYLNKRNSLRDLSDEEFEKQVSSFAKEISENGFIYDTTSPVDLLKDWKSLCKKEVTKEKVNIPATCTTGMKIIRARMPHFYAVKNYKGVSLASLWTAENLEKALRFNRVYHSTPYVSEVVRSLAFTNGLAKITIYRPLMAKTVVNYFNAKSVLDVCVGWGGRMLGSKSLYEVSYTGFEPCKKTFDGLCNIRDTLNLTGVSLYNVPAEEGLFTCIPEDANYDLALTSPPYYNLEIYSDEETQSTKKYANYETWISGFIKPLVQQVTQRVKYSAWSVKNFKTEKKYNLFDDIVQIHKDLGWDMLDVVFSMKNSARPGSGTSAGASLEKQKSEENTYVFAKRI